MQLSPKELMYNGEEPALDLFLTSNLPIHEHIVTNKSLDKLSTDKELVDYISRYSKNRTQFDKYDFGQHLGHLIKEKGTLPNWVKVILENNLKDVLLFVKNQKTLFCMAVLKLVCYLLKLRLEILMLIDNDRRQECFGDKNHTTIQLFAVDDGYYVKKLDQPYLKYSDLVFYEKINQNPNEKFKNHNPLKLLNFLNIKKKPRIHKNVNDVSDIDFNNNYNSHSDNLESLTSPLKQPLNHLNKNHNIYRFEKKNDNQQNNESFSRMISPKNISSQQFGDNNKKTHLSNKIGSESNPFKKTYNNSKNQNAKQKTSVQLQDTTKIEEALKFISSYQIQLQNKSSNNTDKKYKPFVLGKSDELITGRLKFYKDVDKFGFIQLDDGSELFLHKDNLVRSNIDTISFGNCSEFFEIILKFRVLYYKSRNGCSTKAVDIMIENFVPKTKFNNNYNPNN